MTTTTGAAMNGATANGAAVDGGLTAARALVATALAHGVDRAFCVAGESYLAVLDALADVPGIDVVTCRHEGSAAFAAVADAKLTGRPALCLVNRGPGAANTCVALHSAWHDATPVVLIVGQVRRGDVGRLAFQELDCATTFAGMSKGVWEVYEPGRVAETMARALRVAVADTPGPTVVVVPEDVFTGPAPAGPLPGWSAVPGPPDPVALARCVDLLAASRRPLLVAGSRAGTPAARLALRDASRTWDLPVLAANKRQDVFDNLDPYYAGQLTIATQPAQRDLFATADLVLAVGTRLDAVTTLGYTLFDPAGAAGAGRVLVHIYPDPAAIGRVYTPDLGLAADPAAFLRALADAGPPAGAGAAPPTAGPPGSPAAGSPAAERRAWVRRLRAVESAQAVWHPVPAAADGVVFGAVIAELDRLAPPDTVVTVDAGNFTSWIHRYLRMTKERRLLGVASSAMGFGVPGGFGAALRHPDRPVVAIVGDGGFLMTGTELASAVARGCRLVVLIANNASYGTIRAHQERAYPGRVIATDLANPDFAAMARAFGARGLTVDRDDQIELALATALAAAGPTVIDVRTSLEWISAYQRLPGLRRGLGPGSVPPGSVPGSVPPPDKEIR
jgi:acetolactate synthase-1/2/3 large subunit